MNSWDDIKFFLAIAHAGSISAAARALKVNHSTVSRRIRAFEQEQGVRLFEATQRGYELTEAARGVLHVAESIATQSDTLFRSLQGKDQELRGNIYLTMPREIFDFFLADPLKSFIESNPEIHINLAVSKGVRNLANREADMAIRFTPSPPEYLIGKNITPLHHGIYGTRERLNAEQTPVIDWINETGLPSWTEKFKNPYIATRVDDLFSMYTAVKLGIGIARMPCFLPDKLKETEIYRKDIALPKSTWGVWILNHIDLRDTARIKALKAHLSSALTSEIPVFEGRHSNWLED